MTFVWFFACMSSYVHHQHVHGFKRLLFTRASLPIARTILLVLLDVLDTNVVHLQRQVVKKKVVNEKKSRKSA